MVTLRRIFNSIAFYPITVLYVCAVIVVVLVAHGDIIVLVGIVSLAVVAISALLYANWRELRSVHVVVDGQRTELLARINQLAGLLQESGVLVPVGSKAEQDARNDKIRIGHGR